MSAGRMVCLQENLKRIWHRLRDGPRVLVLGYHRVSTAPDPYGLSVSPSHFAEHVEVIRRAGAATSLKLCDPGSVRELYRAESICVTFDDGYADNLHVAKPILEKHGIPATVFVATGLVDSGREFWWDELAHLLPGTDREDPRFRQWHRRLSNASVPERDTLLRELRESDFPGVSPTASPVAPQPLMTREELHLLVADGLVELGAHTVNHPRLPSLDENEQLREMASSKRVLEEIAGAEVDSFAYPYGDWSESTAGLVRRAGFRRACTIEAGTICTRTDPMKLPRLLVPDCDGDALARMLRWAFARHPLPHGSG